MRISFMQGIQAKAREYANADKSIPVEAHHMMAAIVDKAASAFVFNVRISEELTAIKADLEALRRATLGVDGTAKKPKEDVIKLVH